MFSACKDDDNTNGTVELVFKLKYGNETLQMFNNYTYPETGQKLFFSRFSFFLSQVALSDGTTFTDIHDLSYHTLTNSHTGATNAAKGYSYSIADVKPGTYKTLKFGLGVPEESNNKTPAAFPSSHVLSQQAEYWSTWSSYVFTKTEGQIDFNNDGTPEEGFALHDRCQCGISHY